jgi:hypothetical protein
MADYILDNPPTSTDESAISRSVIDEIIEEDERLGREVVDALRAYTRSAAGPRTEFSGFRDFLDCRRVDAGGP